MTPEEEAARFYASLVGYCQDAHVTVQEALPNIVVLIRAVRQAERARAASIASLVFVNDPYALHPDIAFDDLNESARTAAHSIAQIIALLIANAE